LARVETQVVPELVETEEILRAKIEADVAVVGELVRDRGDVDELERAVGDGPLAPPRDLVLPDPEQRVAEIVELHVRIEERAGRDRRVRGKVREIALVQDVFAPAERELDVETVVHPEGSALKVDAHAPDLERVGHGVVAVIVDERVQKLSPEPRREL